MPIKHISITNLGPFPAYELDLPSVAMILGGNGVGKTGLQSCITYVGERGHDPDMLHGDAVEGEVVLTMDTGHQIRAKVAKDITSRMWRTPDAKRWIVNRAYIDEVMSALAYDPIRFLAKEPKEQATELLRLAPIQMDPAEIVTALDGVDASKVAIPATNNPLDSIQAIHDYLYAQRTELHSAAQSLEAHADELQKTLVGLSVEGGWPAKVAALRAEKAKTEETQRTEIAEINSQFQASKTAAESKRADAYSAAYKKYTDELKRIEAEQAGAKEAADAVCANDIEYVRKLGQSAADDIRAKHAPTIADIGAKLAQAELLASQEQHAEGTRQSAAKAKGEAAGKRETWKATDAAIKRLAALRVKLAERLPIKGVLVRDGRIVREQDGGLVPLNKWNTADQMKLALKIGMMVGGKAGFVVVDHVEAFEDKQLKALVATCGKYAEENGIQFILAKVNPAGGGLQVIDPRGANGGEK
jgi:hypothetical protein